MKSLVPAKVKRKMKDYSIVNRIKCRDSLVIRVAPSILALHASAKQLLGNNQTKSTHAPRSNRRIDAQARSKQVIRQVHCVIKDKYSTMVGKELFLIKRFLRSLHFLFHDNYSIRSIVRVL
jgi:hypothetical protein